jgi:hypothetical protein
MKCFNVKCNNILSEDRIKFLDPRSKQRFCTRCLKFCKIGKNPIQWNCSICENILSHNDYELIQLKCNDCQKTRNRDSNYKSFNRC